MKKVYVVMAPDGDSPDAIFTDQAKARRYSEIFDYEKPYEYELDPEVPPVPKGYYPFKIYMNKNGGCSVKRGLVEAEQLPIFTKGDAVMVGNPLFTDKRALWVRCLAKSQDEAIKFADEQRWRMLESGEWDK